MKRLHPLAVLAVLLAACGGADTTTLSCNSPSQSTCLTETVRQSAISEYQPFFDSMCSSTSGASVSDCASDNRVGRCSGTNSINGVAAPYVWSYYASNYTVADVQAMCDRGGSTFTPD